MKTTFSMNISTEILAFKTSSHNHSKWYLEKVKIYRRYNPEPIVFTGNIAILPDTDIQIERISHGEVRIRCKATRAGDPVATINKDDERGKGITIRQRMVILIQNTDQRIKAGQTVLLSFIGLTESVAIGRNIGFSTGTSIPLLRNGSIKLLGHSVFGLKNSLYTGRSFSLDTGDYVKISGGETAAGIVTINEHSALTCSILSVCREAVISRFSVQGYTISATFLDRIVHDFEIQILWASVVFIYGFLCFFKKKGGD